MQEQEWCKYKLCWSRLWTPESRDPKFLVVSCLALWHRSGRKETQCVPQSPAWDCCWAPGGKPESVDWMWGYSHSPSIDRQDTECWIWSFGFLYVYFHSLLGWTPNVKKNSNNGIFYNEILYLKPALSHFFQRDEKATTTTKLKIKNAQIENFSTTAMSPEPLERWKRLVSSLHFWQFWICVYQKHLEVLLNKTDFWDPALNSAFDNQRYDLGMSPLRQFLIPFEWCWMPDKNWTFKEPLP